MESAGVRWSPLESAGVCWSPLDLLCGKSLVGIRRLRWNMLNSGGLRWTPPRQNMQIWPLSHQHNPEIKSSGIRWNPAEHVGECTVLCVHCDDRIFFEYVFVYFVLFSGVHACA